MPPKKKRSFKKAQETFVNQTTEGTTLPLAIPEPKRAAIDVERLKEYFNTQQREISRLHMFKQFAMDQPSGMGMSLSEISQVVHGFEMYRSINHNLAMQFFSLYKVLCELDYTTSIYKTIEARTRVCFEYAENQGVSRSSIWRLPAAWEKRGDEMYAIDLVSMPGPDRWYCEFYNGCAGCESKHVYYRLRSTFVFLCHNCFHVATGTNAEFHFKNLDKMTDLAITVTPNYQDVMTLSQA